MKQISQRVRTKILTLLMAGLAGASFAAAATAAGAGGDVNAGAEADGAANAHMSTPGSENSNAQWQSGATRGADRAAERMSTQGDQMDQSGGANLDATDTAAAKGKSKR